MKNEVKNKSVAFIVLVSVYTGESLRPLRQASCFAYFIYIFYQHRLSSFMISKAALTAWHSMPVCSIDNVIVTKEVLIVTGPSVWVGHHMVCACINRGQPAEEAFIGGGSVLFGSPVFGHIKRVCDNQLSSMEVSAENKRYSLHPTDDGSRFWSHLKFKTKIMVYLKS